MVGLTEGTNNAIPAAQARQDDGATWGPEVSADLSFGILTGIEGERRGGNGRGNGRGRLEARDGQGGAAEAKPGARAGKKRGGDRRNAALGRGIDAGA